MRYLGADPRLPADSMETLLMEKLSDAVVAELRRAQKAAS